MMNSDEEEKCEEKYVTYNDGKVKNLSKRVMNSNEEKWMTE